MSSEEMWNMQSPERLSLLMALKEALHKRPVPAPFWACLQVCDLEKLSELVELAQVTPEPFFKLLEQNCLSIALNWLGLLPYEDLVAESPRDQSEDSLSLPETLTRERDKTTCLLTEDYSMDVVNIVPACLVQQNTENELDRVDRATPEFWQMLGFFFTEERIEKWKQAILILKGDEGCQNQLCVTGRIKSRWASGLMAVLPVELLGDRDLTVRFFWQPVPKHSRFQLIDILETPRVSKNLTNVKGCKEIWKFKPGKKPVPLKSGDTFFLTTDNPATHPLPRYELLEMHWRLNRIVSMSGATAIFDARGPNRRPRDQVWAPRSRKFGSEPPGDDADRVTRTDSKSV